jgi:hypothetical protein
MPEVGFRELPTEPRKINRMDVKSVEQRFASLSVTESHTYTRDSDPTGRQFLNDVVRGKIANDREAKERLGRHTAEMRDAHPHMAERGSGVGSSAFSGFVVPQYLTNLPALDAVAGRPLADAMNTFDLPEQGMSVNLSRITTGMSAAVQSSELSAISWTDADDTLLTVPIEAIAGQEVVSRQLFDRATPAVDTIFQDLLVDYNQAFDSDLINRATTGLSAVAQNVSYTDASPTAPELWPVINKAAALSNAALKGRGRADMVVMRSDRFYWMQETLGSPVTFATLNDPRNRGKDYGSGWVGTFPNGLNVILDDSITTTGGSSTQDEIYVGYSREAMLWETPNGPFFLSAGQVSSTGLGSTVTLVLYNYSASTFSRYTNAFSKITGTGLVAETL